MSARAFILCILLAAVFLYAAANPSAWTRAQAFPTVNTPLAAGERRPVVVELFTSEGCSSCPPADALLIRLEKEQPIEGAEIIPLGFHVDYWNRLGWVDRYSTAEYSRRQSQYADVFSSNGTVYTPQMVVDGQSEFVGGDESRARSAIQAATQAPKVRMQLTGTTAGANRLRLTLHLPSMESVNGDDAPEVWLAVTEGQISTQASTGENAGRRLQHTAVVRYYRSLGQIKPGAEWSKGIELSVPQEWQPENCRVVAVLQARRSRVVLGAVQAPLKSFE